MSTSKINIKQTFDDAHDEGTLSQASLNALTNIPNIGIAIQNGLGIPVDQVGASEVILLSILIDDSSSMSGNETAVRDGFNMLITALKDSKQQDNIQVALSYLNQGVILPYTPLDQVPSLTTKNFSVQGCTPLFKQSVTTLGTVVAKLQDFENNGIQVRSISLIMTDGGDNDSGSTTASDVSVLIKDMIQAEKHIIAGMGFGSDETYFRGIFSDMGVDDTWVYTANATPAEIRKAFNVFSQSAVRASQSAANFSQTAMGGFGS